MQVNDAKFNISICLCSFGMIPTSPLPIHTPLMPNQSIEISLPINTIGPVMKMDPLNNLQVPHTSSAVGTFGKLETAVLRNISTRHQPATL